MVFAKPKEVEADVFREAHRFKSVPNRLGRGGRVPLRPTRRVAEGVPSSKFFLVSVFMMAEQTCRRQRAQIGSRRKRPRRRMRRTTTTMCNAITLASPRPMWNGIANPMMTARPTAASGVKNRHDPGGRRKHETNARGQFSEPNESMENDTARLRASNDRNRRKCSREISKLNSIETDADVHPRR